MVGLRVLISGPESSWRSVAGVVPQESILAPVVVNLFISNLNEETMPNAPSAGLLMI